MFTGPKKIKYKKTKKGKLSKYDFKANDLKFGTVGLKATESGIINTRQIEAARQAIVRKIKRKGKGQISHWAARVKGETVLFEICGINFNLVYKALKTGGSKLPIKTKIFN